MKPGRSTTVRIVCTKCRELVELTAQTYRHGPKVELKVYLEKMAEQWEWDLTKRAELCGWCRERPRTETSAIPRGT